MVTMVTTETYSLYKDITYIESEARIPLHNLKPVANRAICQKTKFREEVKSPPMVF